MLGFEPLACRAHYDIFNRAFIDKVYMYSLHNRYSKKNNKLTDQLFQNASC